MQRAEDSMAFLSSEHSWAVDLHLNETHREVR